MIKSRIKRFNNRFYPKKIFFSPEWLVLGVNNICNLHCKMCDVGLQNNDTNFAVNLTGTQPLNMPLELTKKIIDQSSKYFRNCKIGFAFTEPLVYPHLIESLDYANNKGRYTTITTNALNLKRKVDDLVHAGLNEIFISLDGPQDIHNEIRGNKKSFQSALEGIETFMEKSNSPEISVFCCITEWNIGHLKEFADFFKNYKLKSLGFMHTNYSTNEIAQIHNLTFGHNYPATYSSTGEVNFANMDLNKLWEEISDIKSESYPFKVIFSPEIKYEKGLDLFYHHPEIKIGKSCNDIYRNIMIKSDGSVIPAHGRCYNLTIGNLYQNNLKEIWNSSVLNEFRKTLNKQGGLLPACSRCCSAF